jgi:uncharacterized membrane protein
MSEPANMPIGQRHARRTQWVVVVLLALPYVALCFPQMYARATPALLGFPFFYWYQLVWVVLTSALLYAVYRLKK